MKNITKKSSILLAFHLLLAMPVAQADWGVSVGANNSQERYKDPKAAAIADFEIEYRGEKFNVDRNAVSYDFTNSKQYAIEAILKNNIRGFDADDHKSFNGLKDRDDSIDVGVRGIYNTGFGPVILEMTRDVNASKGYGADLRIGGIEPHANHWDGKQELKIVGLAGVKYQSDKVIDYHYGVRTNEATATRSAYKGKAATTPYIGFESQFNINKKVTLNAGVIYERRDDSIRNSPLTNQKKSDVLLNLGVTYWF